MARPSQLRSARGPYPSDLSDPSDSSDPSDLSDLSDLSDPSDLSDLSDLSDPLLLQGWLNGDCGLG